MVKNNADQNYFMKQCSELQGKFVDEGGVPAPEGGYQKGGD